MEVLLVELLIQITWRIPGIFLVNSVKTSAEISKGNSMLEETFESLVNIFLQMLEGCLEGLVLAEFSIIYYVTYCHLLRSVPF